MSLKLLPDSINLSFIMKDMIVNHIPFKYYIANRMGDYMIKTKIRDRLECIRISIHTEPIDHTVNLDISDRFQLQYNFNIDRYMYLKSIGVFGISNKLIRNIYQIHKDNIDIFNTDTVDNLYTDESKYTIRFPTITLKSIFLYDKLNDISFPISLLNITLKYDKWCIRGSNYRTNYYHIYDYNSRNEYRIDALMHRHPDHNESCYTIISNDIKDINSDFFKKSIHELFQPIYTIINKNSAKKFLTGILTSILHPLDLNLSFKLYKIIDKFNNDIISLDEFIEELVNLRIYQINMVYKDAPINYRTDFSYPDTEISDIMILTLYKDTTFGSLISKYNNFDIKRYIENILNNVVQNMEPLNENLTKAIDILSTTDTQGGARENA